MAIEHAPEAERQCPGAGGQRKLILHTGQSDPKISLSESGELAITSSERGLEFCSREQMSQE
jgi:hypothetical protein